MTSNSNEEGMNKMIRKSVFNIILALGMISSSAIAETDIKININSTELVCDPTAIVENDRVLVPMRAIFEELGAKVVWDGEMKSIFASKDNFVIAMQIDNPTMHIMSEENTSVELDVAPIIYKDRTMVPLRAVAEALKISIVWNEDTRSVNID